MVLHAHSLTHGALDASVYRASSTPAMADTVMGLADRGLVAPSFMLAPEASPMLEAVGLFR